jgi:hypothetical protein
MQGRMLVLILGRAHKVEEQRRLWDLVRVLVPMLA